MPNKIKRYLNSGFFLGKAAVLLVLVAVIVFMSNASSSTECPGMEAEQYFNVMTKEQMNTLIENEILSKYSSSGIVNWDCMISDFAALGERATVEIIPGGGFEGADILRFTVDNSNFLTELLSAPGASNGVFTAIVNRTPEGNVAIVERGGQLKWLRLG